MQLGKDRKKFGTDCFRTGSRVGTEINGFLQRFQIALARRFERGRKDLGSRFSQDDFFFFQFVPQAFGEFYSTPISIKNQDPLSLLQLSL